MAALTEYQELGFETRKAYLINLAEDHGVDRSQVFALASVLGPSEDFDGLVSHLEDIN